METSNIKSTCIEIIFSSNGFSLNGVLHLPAASNPPVVIGSHGLLADKNSPKQMALAEKCNALGIAYFRFDYRGCGDSQGDSINDTSLETRCEDLLNAIRCIRSRHETGNQMGLFGSSFGGTVSMATAVKIRIDSLVTFAAPVRSRELSASHDMPRHLSKGSLQFDISPHLSSIGNILVIHGELDTVVPLSHAHEIYHSVREPKKMIIQKNGDHPMSHAKHQKQFANQAARWFKQGFFGSR